VGVLGGHARIIPALVRSGLYSAVELW